ncbi:MAG: hypothetical protein IKQ17_10085, partial [Kiritimatiellae bacterium]|nr:hypothetical protein [Kiritimatiellia bacterium]
FLGAGEWKCRLFRDADPAIESGLGKVTVESVPVAPTMKVEAAARGGLPRSSRLVVCRTAESGKTQEACTSMRMAAGC